MQNSKRLFTRARASLFLFVLTFFHALAYGQTDLSSSGTRAVPTYESAGLYWARPGANATTGCEVKFRKAGDTAWTEGLPMWFDARDGECRGSLVSLMPGTTYEAQFNLPGVQPSRATTFTTWANTLRVARTIAVRGGSGTLEINEGGSASTGYVLYDGSNATLDAANSAPFNVTINASYVIVRGLTLKGARQDAIRISEDVKDVVIEENDISGWGRTRDGRWGYEMDSGIHAVCKNGPTLERVTIQRNRIHDPRYGANSWSDGHPEGPQAITISYCGGNHVIRYNEMYSTNGNYFNDVIGGEDNFSTTGFPNADSDIYSNKISHGWDDGIEAEGGNKNVRIWGNYIDRTATGIATTVVSVGPVYIFRNVFNRNQFYEKTGSDYDDRQPFFKAGSDASLGDGRRYVFHNTMLQATSSGSSYGLGGGAGMGGTGDSHPVKNTISMNNIYHLWKPVSAFFQVGSGTLLQNDMFNGRAGAAMTNGINATPTYAEGHGWRSESGGQYALASGTPGFDQAVRIANFNDAFVGEGPDVGAAEAGAPPMRFGLEAPGTPTAPGATQAPSPKPPSPIATPAPSGTDPVSMTIDSSSYNAASGDNVTFTLRVFGNAGQPTGVVEFRDNGAILPGCAAVTISNGEATCSTSSLARGEHRIAGLYSGDRRYGAGIAGVITQTVH